jgi:Glutamine cyclotransferase
LDQLECQELTLFGFKRFPKIQMHRWRRFRRSCYVRCYEDSVLIAMGTLGRDRNPHSIDSYTEGFFNGMFYEGTGGIGRSPVLVSDRTEKGPDTPTSRSSASILRRGDRRSGSRYLRLDLEVARCFVYDRVSLQPVKQFTYSGEGWGMTRTTKEADHKRWCGYAAISRPQYLQGNSPHRGERRKHQRRSTQ